MKWRLLFILGFLLTGPLGWAASATEEMFWAVQNGNRSAVKRLLAQDKTLVYGQDAQGMTPFLIAVQNGDLDMAVLLADAFSRLDTDCPLGNAVHIAVLNEDAAMLRVLFQLCDEEDPDLATLMLNMRRHWGAPKSKTNDGNTPLHLAALKCHRPMYQFLVANGANPTVRNNKGKTPAQLLTACPPEPQKPEKAQESPGAAAGPRNAMLAKPVVSPEEEEPSAAVKELPPSAEPAKPVLLPPPPDEPLVFPVE